MSTDRDLTRIVRSWLRTDEHESADRVLDHVLAVLDATPQRRSLWPARRIADMNTFAKLAIAAAAVLVVAVVGYNLLPASGGVGTGPAASPSPTPSPSLQPSPSAEPAAFAYPDAGELAVGKRYSLTVEGVPFSLSVPTSGWISSGNSYGFSKGPSGSLNESWMLFWNPDNVYADPCAQTTLKPPAGPSVADLAGAVSTIPGTDATGPSDVTVGGRAGKHVVLIVREDIACNPEQYFLWYNVGEDDDCPGAVVCGRYATALGDTIRVWIVEVNGARIFIEAETRKGASPEIGQEIQDMVDSIQFE